MRLEEKLLDDARAKDLLGLIKGRYLCLEVSDNGPGFDPELLGQVFEPYVTSKTKGTGLGLATVRRLVEINKGEVYFSSEIGVGSTFTVRFPLDPEKGYARS